MTNYDRRDSTAEVSDDGMNVADAEQQSLSALTTYQAETITALATDNASLRADLEEVTAMALHARRVFDESQRENAHLRADLAQTARERDAAEQDNAFLVEELKSYRLRIHDAGVARDAAVGALRESDAAWGREIEKVKTARAAALCEAADVAELVGRNFSEDGGDREAYGADAVAGFLRRMAEGGEGA